MPLEPDLEPYVLAIGDGATADLGRRVKVIVEQARAEAAAAVPRTTLTLAPFELKAGRVYVVHLPDGVDPADLDTSQVEETGARFIVCAPGCTVAELTGPGSELVAQLIAERDAARAEAAPPDVALLVADRDRIRDEQEQALAVLRDVLGRLGDVESWLGGFPSDSGAEQLEEARERAVALLAKGDGQGSTAEAERIARTGTDTTGSDVVVVITCTTCGEPLDSPPCIPTPDGRGGHTSGGGVMAAGEDDIDWDDAPDPVTADEQAALSAELDATHATRLAAESAPEPTNAEIRKWALEHDVPVSARGAVQRSAREAYVAANPEAGR